MPGNLAQAGRDGRTGAEGDRQAGEQADHGQPGQRKQRRPQPGGEVTQASAHATLAVREEGRQQVRPVSPSPSPHELEPPFGADFGPISIQKRPRRSGGCARPRCDS
jgi:hypothetical protein